MGYEYYDTAEEVSHGYLRPGVDRFLQDVKEGAIILDMGCGNGSFIAWYQGHKGWKLYGTDSSESGIAIANESYPGVRFILADSQKPSDELLALTGKVDVVISTEVIEHVYAPKDFLRNAYQMLRPGGMLIVSTPYHGYLKNLALSLAGKMDQHFTVLWDHGHIKFWSRRTLMQALAEVGFSDFAFNGAGRIP